MINNSQNINSNEFLTNYINNYANNCLNVVGFIFDKAKVLIKKDNTCKYSNNYCQECFGINFSNGIHQNCNKCDKCSDNTQYKICIFKLKKEHFISSSLDISTDLNNSWEIFKKNIIYQTNGNFVISLTCNKMHSFYGNMIKAKNCNCCDSVLLYFKYNVIPANIYQGLNQQSNQVITFPYVFGDYTNVCANTYSNITYNLKSGNYTNIKFFNSPLYTFGNKLCSNEL